MAVLALQAGELLSQLLDRLRVAARLALSLESLMLRAQLVELAQRTLQLGTGLVVPLS
jgi:hypothetical protein